MLSKQVGATTTGSTSGTTTSGGTTSGGTTSGGTTSGGSTSGNPPPAGCVQETEDSRDKHPLEFTTCVAGTFSTPKDEDWVRYQRTKGKIFFNFQGPVLVRIWDEDGKDYDLDHIPNKEGTYDIQLQYDFDNHPLNGDQLKQIPPLQFDWRVELTQGG